MNYGKKKASKKQKEISSKSKMQKKKMGVRIFKGFLLCCILFLIVGVTSAGFFFKKILDETPDISPAKVKPSNFSSFLYAQDNTVLEQLASSGANRVYKSITEIPVDLQHAFVAIEDERFYTHNGIDLQGIARAAVVGLAKGNFSEGASTLTQQLIKNNVFPNFIQENTFYDRIERKVQEQFLAVEIEKQMSKDEILEAYMNTINLGQNNLGVQSAAKSYFGKDVSELTLSESTVIAGITQNPTKFNPVTNPADNAERRQKVLGDMLKQKYITQAAYDEAVADPVYERIQNLNTDIIESPYTYYVDAVVQRLIKDLQSEPLNFTAEQAYTAVYSGGLSIYTTQDLGIQAICDEEFNNPANYPANIEYGVDYRLTITKADKSVQNYSTEMFAEYIRAARGDENPKVYSSPEDATAAIEEYKTTLGIQEGDIIDEKLSLAPQPQASIVIMEQSTGQVKAMVGGRGPKNESLSLNRATDSERQPGSCFKILSTYAPALDVAGKTLATSIKDEPYKYDTGMEIENWWGKSYKGNQTIRAAIEQSMNIIAVKVFSEITPQLGVNYLKNFGISTLVDADVVQPTALGGITNGVKNIELTAAYAAIANGGIYTEPILYTKVLDHDGNVLIDNTPKQHTVIQDTTAALLTNAMLDVVNKPNGTGTRAKIDGMPVSGKTGTTSENVDIWFAGYTPYLTASVWGGYDANKKMRENDTHWHLDLWQSIMSRVHAGAPYVDFVLPASIEQKTVCPTSGMLAVSGACSNAYAEYFAPGTVPTQTCTAHVGSYNKNNKKDTTTDVTKPTTDPTTPPAEEPVVPPTDPVVPPTDPVVPPTDPVVPPTNPAVPPAS